MTITTIGLCAPQLNWCNEYTCQSPAAGVRSRYGKVFHFLSSCVAASHVGAICTCTQLASVTLHVVLILTFFRVIVAFVRTRPARCYLEPDATGLGEKVNPTRPDINANPNPIRPDKNPTSVLLSITGTQ